jgi:uncharacterized protein
MKCLTLILITAGFFISGASLCAAEPEMNTKPSFGIVNDLLRKEFTAASAWDIGGQFRIRSEAKDGGLFPKRDFAANLDPSNDYYLFHTKAHLGRTPAKWITAYVEGRDSHDVSDDRAVAENDRLDLHVSFPISGVKTWIFLPPLVAFAVSFFASMGGVSGAFLLLPFQVSFLHFVSPSVSSTNFVYNIIAIPSGVYRYIRESRMVWPLAWIVIMGTLPGVLLGYYIRVLYLPNPKAFRLFVGCVLLYVGARLLREAFGGNSRPRGIQTSIPDNGTNSPAGSDAAAFSSGAIVKPVSRSSRVVEYDFCGERFSFGIPRMLGLAFVVGIVGGAYGIGGGSIISPFCMAFFGLPVYTVAGAALLGTFLTSVAGVFFYSVMPAKAGVSTLPDWPLGILFGLGGLLGMYCGARLQKHVPQKFIKTMLSLVMLFLAISYIVEFFAR